MGYRTDFSGTLTLSKELTKEQLTFVNSLSETRRMSRDNTKLLELYKGEHGYPNADKTNANEVYGLNGEYFVGGTGDGGQDYDDSIIDYNTPSESQPGLWCNWMVEGTELEWDGGEKFYYYVEWLNYLVHHCFNPWGVKLNGKIMFRGEEMIDVGVIRVVNNNIEVEYFTF
jgi:hypothetical protein